MVVCGGNSGQRADQHLSGTLSDHLDAHGPTRVPKDSTKFGRERVGQELRTATVVAAPLLALQQTADILRSLRGASVPSADGERAETPRLLERDPAAIAQAGLGGAAPPPAPLSALPRLQLDRAKGIVHLALGRAISEREIIGMLASLAAHLGTLGSDLRCVLIAELCPPRVASRASERSMSALHDAIERLIERYVPIACSASGLSSAACLAAESAAARLLAVSHHSIVSSAELVRAGCASELASEGAMPSRLRAFGSWVEQQPAIGLTKMLDLVNFHRTEPARNQNKAAHEKAVALAKARLSCPPSAPPVSDHALLCRHLSSSDLCHHASPPLTSPLPPPLLL